MPKNDDELVIATSTTQIEKRYKQRFHKVLVRVSPSEYSGLPEESVINCDSAKIVPRDSLLRWISNNKLTPLAPLPNDVLRRLQAAVKHTSTLTARQKRLVLGDEEDDNQT